MFQLILCLISASHEHLLDDNIVLLLLLLVRDDLLVVLVGVVLELLRPLGLIVEEARVAEGLPLRVVQVRERS